MIQRRGRKAAFDLEGVLVNEILIKSKNCYNVALGGFGSVKENSLNHPAILDALEQKVAVPAYLEFDAKKLTGKYVRIPERSELNSEINESLIVEFYNR